MSPVPRERLEHVLISDVHLNEIVARAEPGWWEYKGPDTRQDAELEHFLAAIEARRPDWFDGTEIIFNGDTFDFDLVYSSPEGVKAPIEGLPPNVWGSVYKMRRILGDHPRFVSVLARFLSRGNRAIFVMGNHDRELCFAEVQEVLRQTVARAAPPGRAHAVAEAISFEPWFVYRPGVLYVEHGQQYDATCSYRDVLDTIVPPDRTHPAEVETPFGSMMGRHSLCRLGTFNPYNDESFILSLGGYVKHMRAYYIGRGKPFFRAYFTGTWYALRELRGRARRARARTEDTTERYRAYGAAKGVPPGFIDELKRLASPPIVDRMRLWMHELWLDRFLLMLVVAALFVVGLFVARTLFEGLLLLTLVPLLVFAMRALGRGSLALQERARWGLVAEQIANGADVPVVAFGHSHRPERRPLTRGGRYYNLGSWAPVVESDRGSTLWRARRYLVLRPAANGQVHAAFARWSSDR